MSYVLPESRRNALIIISYNPSLGAINEKDLRRTVDACGWIAGNIKSWRVGLIVADVTAIQTHGRFLLEKAAVGHVIMQPSAV
jgi:hypothetical protein